MLFGFESEKSTPVVANQEQPRQPDNGAGGNLLDLDMMLGAGASENQNQIQSSGLMDLIGGPPMQPQNPMGGLLDPGMSMPQQNPNDLMGMGMGAPAQSNQMVDLLGGGMQQMPQPVQ